MWVKCGYNFWFDIWIRQPISIRNRIITRVNMEEMLYFCLLKNCQNLKDYNSKLRILLINSKIHNWLTQFLGESNRVLLSCFSRNWRYHQLDFDLVKIKAFFAYIIMYILYHYGEAFKWISDLMKKSLLLVIFLIVLEISGSEGKGCSPPPLNSHRPYIYFSRMFRIFSYRLIWPYGIDRKESLSL